MRTPIVDDAIDEAAETFDLTATVTAGTTANTDDTGTTTITDDDGAPAITIDDVSVNEAAGSMTFTVSLSNPSASAATVDYDTATATATEGTDFANATGSSSCQYTEVYISQIRLFIGIEKGRIL